MITDAWTKDRFTEVGNACKEREAQLRGVTDIAPGTSFMIRVDGRAFHTFTKGLSRPFSEPLRTCMKAAAEEVMQQLGAKFAYFQSDEITYVWTGSTATGYSHPFNGRVEKLLTTIASLTSVAFYIACTKYIDDVTSRPIPTFDARLAELADVENNSSHDVTMLTPVMWRENDAIRNSTAMVAQSYFSQTELQGKSTSEQRIMCTMKGFDWTWEHSQPYLRGTYLTKRTQTITLTNAELAHIPTHRRPDVGQTFQRKTIVPRTFVDNMDIGQRAVYLFGSNQ